MQARMGAGIGDLNLSQGRALLAERHLYFARASAREAGVLIPNPEALRVSMMSPPLELVELNRALLRYHRLKRSEAFASTSRSVQGFQDRLVDMQSKRDDLQALVDRLSDGTGAVSRTYEGWARLFLAAIGAPDCGDNLLVVVAWQTQESTAARFNPLATTHSMAGATNFNSVGVKNYMSVQQGVRASVETLTGGAASYGYESILSSLRGCSPAAATARWINASAWCRGCTGGAYLTGLIPIVEANYPDYAAR